MFKIKDIVTGIDSTENPYSKTTSDAIMEVTRIIHTSIIEVKILEHKRSKDWDGKKYRVQPKYFQLVSEHSACPFL